MEHMKDAMRLWVATIKDSVLDSLDIETADHLIESLSHFVEMLLKKKADGVDISLAEKHYSDFLDFCLRSLAAF